MLLGSLRCACCLVGFVIPLSAWAALEVTKQEGCDVLLEGDPLPAVGSKVVIESEDPASLDPSVAEITAAKGKLASGKVVPNQNSGSCGSLVGLEVDWAATSALQKAAATAPAKPSAPAATAGRERWAPGVVLAYEWWSDASHASGAEATFSGPGAVLQVTVPFWRKKRFQLVWRAGAHASSLSHASTQHIERSADEFKYEDSGDFLDALAALDLQVSGCFLPSVRCGLGAEYGLAVTSHLKLRKAWSEGEITSEPKGGVGSYHRLALGGGADMRVWRGLQAGLLFQYHVLWMSEDEDPRNVFGSSFSGPSLGLALNYLL